MLRKPEAVQTLLAGFRSTDEAGAAVSGVIAAGILPAAIEMMDALTIEAAEAAVAPGYPPGAGAVLLVELDGVAVQVEEDMAAVRELCLACGAFEIRVAADEAERALLWRGRKAAFAAMGRVATDYYVQDGVVPADAAAGGAAADRRALGASSACGSATSSTPATATCIRSCSTTRAPARRPGRRSSPRRSSRSAWTRAARSPASTASAWTRRARCRRCSASATSRRSRGCARAFDPDGLANPGKVLPTPRLCGEVPGPYRAHPLERLGLAERL